ncbi:hypothetical protein KL930_000175 [Ogataea haglerorum]|uniref:Protein PNS1 n=1 Tax=Ogataea haglerorum TaxID=1937702 RepID=A0ABQ7RE85_9ASCO|nr:hypothetical protein KL915_000403 [Ogataea haglerorum]KAG7709330.1 hypothetical protein KL914_001720 [Ogataea haglerorum]KAG7717807.1 hypothetical protein KL913_002743 [Ogataea haglerorum]KAG7718109.1 hypothetical protein KL949_003081 [Ogataea haglerorum]KAG7742256.1 hypothetical protein KL932_002398 [Ogataea haglerorum]
MSPYQDDLPGYDEAAPPAYCNDDIEVGAGGEKYKLDVKKPLPSDDFEESFRVEQPTWKDWPFAVVFQVVLVLFMGLLVFTTHDVVVEVANVNREQARLICLVFATGVACTYGGIVVLRKWPAAFFNVGCLLNVAAASLLAVGALSNDNLWAGVMFSVLALVSILGYLSVRRRIPLSSLLLKQVIDVAQNNPVTWKISAAGTLVSAVFSLATVLVVYGTMVKWGLDETGQLKNKTMFVATGIFVLFAGFYIAEVLKNVLHSTVAGVYGSWYYLSHADRCPQNAGLAAFRRSVTYSFGSICFGSLIVSVIQTLSNVAGLAKQWAAQEGGLAGYIGFYIIEIFASIMEAMVRWLNEKAYSLVSLYGLDFLHAARGAFALVEQRGLSALINDCLINTALGLYSLLVAYACGLVSAVFLFTVQPAWAQNTDGVVDVNVEVVMTVLFASAFGFFVASVATSVVHSGAVTFFIMLAKDPEVYKATHPDEFAQVLAAYPDVERKLQVDGF